MIKLTNNITKDKYTDIAYEMFEFKQFQDLIIFSCNLL